MKSKIITIILLFFYFSQSFAENINIQAKNISIDKDKEISIFEREVKVTTEDGLIIKSDYATYDKKSSSLTLRNNITAIDKSDNKIITNYAEYNSKTKIFETKGSTKNILFSK